MIAATPLASQPPSESIMDGRAALAADPRVAARIFQAYADADPSDAESRYWLYSAQKAAGRSGLAKRTLDEARTLHAMAFIAAADGDLDRMETDPVYCGQVGLNLYASKMMGPASFALGRSLRGMAPDPQLMLGYGLSLQHQGRMNEAVEIFTAAAKHFPNAAVHEFLIYPLFHAADRLQRVSDEARRWSDLYCAPFMPAKVAFANERSVKRRLRIGYVGPSFTRNQLAQFLPPVLENHDPQAVEVFLYCADPAAEVNLPDGMQTRAIFGVSDADVAAMIRHDKIDILVDVWGHTAGSRLPVFAYRPAPVQVAWINFVQTTGLSCMDYVLHADSMHVPGVEQYFTEEIWRLGPIVAPSRVSAERPDPVPTPALRRGYVTFGSFNNPAKLSEVAVAAWARILVAMPSAKLVLKYSYYADPVLQRVTQARFAAYGAYPEQLEFRGHTTGLDYWREFQDIDLALDTSPCPGGTTSCDALANGVPVLTQWGDDFYSRIGVPVVQPCGLDELIADGWDDFVAKAIALTSDFDALNALRAKTRAGFDASPYCDEVGFTRTLEDAFRQMFAKWLVGVA